MSDSINVEVMELEYRHYIERDGERIKLEEPVVVKKIVPFSTNHHTFVLYDTFVLNEMFDKMKEYLLRLADKDGDE